MPQSIPVRYDQGQAAAAVASAQAVRTAAGRAAGDLLLVYENVRDLTVNEQLAISTVRGICHEARDGDRPVG